MIQDLIERIWRELIQADKKQKEKELEEKKKAYRLLKSYFDYLNEVDDIKMKGY